MAPTVLHRYAAFTTDRDGGDPAGAGIGETLPDSGTTQRIAAEIGYSETAFVAPSVGAVICNNLASLPASSFRYPTREEKRAALAVRLDMAVRENAPAGWEGDQAREAQLRNALCPIPDRDRQATSALFEIIRRQPGY